MTYAEKCEYILSIQESDIKILNEKQKTIINRLSNDNESVIRSDVAITLIDFVDNFSKNILIKLLNDKDYLVRAEAADSLRYFYFQEVYELLKESTNDTHYLVRGYAIYSMTCVGIYIQIENNIIKQIINNLLKREKNYFVKLNCYNSLYDLGCEEQFNNIISIFKSTNYRNRCAVINVLGYILSNKNYKDIKIFITKKIDNEPVYAVLSSMKKLLDRINDDFE